MYFSKKANTDPGIWPTRSGKGFISSVNSQVKQTVRLFV